MGINFHSMRSHKTKPWLIDIRKEKVYDCRIECNSSTQNLKVCFTGHIVNGKQVKSCLSYGVDLRDFLPERVVFGFSAATGYMFKMNTLLSWSFNSSLQSDHVMRICQIRYLPCQPRQSRIPVLHQFPLLKLAPNKKATTAKVCWWGLELVLVWLQVSLI